MRGRGAAAALCCILGSAAAGAASAGAWPMPKGETQLIFKYEHQEADEAFGVGEVEVPVPPRSDDSLTLWMERGLTSSLTFQGKASWGQGEDGALSYDGRGPIELGLRQVVFRRKRAIVSVYAGAALAGEGRNAGYALPGQGKGDLELRVLMGNNRRLFGREVFEEVQAARLWRRGLPDELRLDSTVGLHLSRRWMVLAQTYSGMAEAEPVRPWWFKAEASLVRRAGPWSLQAGWRQTLAGRDTPKEGGPVLAVWRRF
jgi:protein XagA